MLKIFPMLFWMLDLGWFCGRNYLKLFYVPSDLDKLVYI